MSLWQWAQIQAVSRALNDLLPMQLPRIASLEIGSPQAVVNLRVAVLEERVAEKRPFSSLFAPTSRRNVWQSFDKRSKS